MLCIANIIVFAKCQNEMSLLMKMFTGAFHRLKSHTYIYIDVFVFV